MSHKFDELTKTLAQSVTRRAALKQFGIGLAGVVAACFGLANKAQGNPIPCQSKRDCPSGQVCCKSTSANYCTFQAFCKGLVQL
jgi:hypothetical protein